MRTKARSASIWIGAIVVALGLALPFAAQPQTAETFKSGGPIPYREYLRKTGDHAPGAKPKPKPKPVAAKPAPAPAAPGTASKPITPSPPATVAPPPKPVPAPPPTAPPPPAKPAPAAQTPPASAITSTPLGLLEGAPLAPTSSPAGGRLAPAAAIPPAELEAFVDGGVRQAMAADHIVGAAVVAVQDGQVVLEKGYGLARLSPATPVDPQRTLFRLGSVSKVLTWLEVLKQIDAKRLSVDTPVDDLLPPDMKLGLEGFAEPVRLRHLITHTAGFEARELGRLFKEDPRRLKGLGGSMKRERSRRVREAGRLTSYSNYGAALAGAAVAAVAKAPFVQAMEDDLLKPAGLTSTTFREPYPEGDGLPSPMPKALADRLSDGLRRVDGGWRVLPFAYGSDFAPAVSASASPHDMGTLMLQLQPLSANPRQPTPNATPSPPPAWSEQVPLALYTKAPSPTPGVPGWTYGLQEMPLAGGFAGFGQGGAVPGFRARLLLVPQLRLGVFIAANTDSGQGLADRLPASIVARFYGPPPGAAPPAAPIDVTRYAGLYLTTRRAYHGLEGMVDRLARAERIGVGPDGQLVIHDADGGARAYLPAGPDRFVSTEGGWSIAFAADPKRPDGPARLLTDPERAEGAVREGWVHEPATLAAATVVAAGAALLCLASLALRSGRDARQTRGQALASAVQAVAAGAWLLAVLGFLIFRHGAKDAASLMFHWPNPWLVGASWAALAASLLGLVQLAQLRDVWWDRRRVQGWSAARRLTHTGTALIFLAYTAVLAAWGALEPWSS